MSVSPTSFFQTISSTPPPSNSISFSSSPLHLQDTADHHQICQMPLYTPFQKYPHLGFSFCQPLPILPTLIPTAPSAQFQYSHNPFGPFPPVQGLHSHLQTLTVPSIFSCKCVIPFPQKPPNRHHSPPPLRRSFPLPQNASPRPLLPPNLPSPSNPEPPSTANRYL